MGAKLATSGQDESIYFGSGGVETIGPTLYAGRVVGDAGEFRLGAFFRSRGKVATDIKKPVLHLLQLHPDILRAVMMAEDYAKERGEFVERTVRLEAHARLLDSLTSYQ